MTFSFTSKSILMKDPKLRASYLRSLQLYKKVQEIKDEINGNSPPSVFIGSKSAYPKVNVGILSPPEHTQEAWLYDDHNFWASHDFTIAEIIQLRSNLINSRFKTNVYNVNNNERLLNIAQEIASAAKPVDLEIKLRNNLHFAMDFDNHHLPLGPRADLAKITITENPKVNHHVDKVISDDDMKAVDAINYLLQKGINEQTLSKLLSVGVLGLKKNRKLVPTRWSITATDDTLGKNYLNEIRNFEIIDNYEYYYGYYLGNYYFIILFPYVFNYELFEAYLPGSNWNPDSQLKVSNDFESLFGRKNYAYNTAGGYYATRLAVLENLFKRRKQASALVIRLETPEYWASLGVWVVRASSRRTMQNQPKLFFDRKSALNKIHKDVLTQFNCDINPILNRSEVLSITKTQTLLKQFL